VYIYEFTQSFKKREREREAHWETWKSEIKGKREKQRNASMRECEVHGAKSENTKVVFEWISLCERKWKSEKQNKSLDKYSIVKNTEKDWLMK